jgi:hypothetical protein
MRILICLLKTAYLNFNRCGYRTPAWPAYHQPMVITRIYHIITIYDSWQ